MAPDARTQAMEVLYAHRPAHGDLFDCECGWTGDGFGDAHRRHVVAELLTARVPCPTCSGTGKVRNPSELGPGMHVNTVSSVPCPDCDDGRGGPLVLLAPKQVGWRVNNPIAYGLTTMAVGSHYPNDVPVYVARPENEER